MRMDVRAFRAPRATRAVMLSWITVAMLCIPAFAQVTTSSFYGTVKDSSGGVVVGATVTLLNESTGAASTKKTDTAGDFGFDFLRVGQYTIKIEAPGFKTLQSTTIDLRAGQNVRRAFTLELGAVNETVSVEGVAPLVNAVSAEQSHDVTTMEAAQLPLAKRNIGNLLGLGTGVSAGDGYVRLNGVGKTGTLYTVDGTNATADPESRTTSMRGNFEQINLLSLEAVQEVHTTKGILPAEYGQALGGNVNIITKSGSNNWHGSAFENFQSDNLNSRLQFLKSKPNAVFNQFGGSVGGPIVHDRAFFFADYEGYRQSITQVLSSTVPTPEFRQQLIAAVPDYATPLKDVPLPNQSYTPGAESALYLTGGSQTANDNHIDLKSDIRLTDMSNLALTYTHGRPVLTTPRIYLNNANDQTYHGFTERGTASYVTGGTSWTSETRFGYNRNDMDRTDAYFLQGINETLPFGGRLPDLVYSSFSTLNSELWLEEGNTWSLEEKYAKFAGKHSLKFGVIYMRFNIFRTNPENPKISYNNRADLFANIPNSMQFTIGNGSYDGVNSTIGAFAQDDWRVTPKLTVNLGLRYDYYSKFVATPRVSGTDFGLYNLDGLLDSQFHFGPVRDPQDPYNSDGWVNLAPRLGFSYDPTGKGKTTIRGGYGVMFSPPAPGVFSGAVGGKYLPFRVTLSRQEGIDYGFHFPLYNDSIAPILEQQQRVQPTIVINPDLQTPYVLSSYFGVQHALTRSLVLEIGVRRKSRSEIPDEPHVQLPGSRNRNPAQPEPGAGVLRGQLADLLVSLLADFASPAVRAQPDFLPELHVGQTALYRQRRHRRLLPEQRQRSSPGLLRPAERVGPRRRRHNSLLLGRLGIPVAVPRYRPECNRAAGARWMAGFGRVFGGDGTAAGHHTGRWGRYQPSGCRWWKPSEFELHADAAIPEQGRVRGSTDQRCIRAPDSTWHARARRRSRTRLLERGPVAREELQSE